MGVRRFPHIAAGALALAVLGWAGGCAGWRSFNAPQPVRPVPVTPALPPTPTTTSAPASKPVAPQLTPAQRLELDTLRAQLADPKRPDAARREAAATLLTRDYPQAWPVVAEVLADAANRPAQLALAEAIAQGKPTQLTLVPPLRTMLDSDDSAVRLAGAAALAAYRDAGVQSDLAALAMSRLTARLVRLAVVGAMQRVLDKPAVETLVCLLDDADDEVAVAASESLARLTSIHSFGRSGRLWKAWWAQNKDKPQSQWLADLAENLSRAADALEKENLVLRRRLAQGMTDLYNATPAAGKDALLVELLKDPAAEVRLAGCQLAAQRISAAAPVPDALRQQVRERLSDAEPAVRQVAAALVSLGGGPDAMKLLAERLDAEQAPEVRQAIYLSLGGVADATVWDKLLAGVRQPDVREASAAAAAMAKVVDRHALPDQRRAETAAALEKRLDAASGADAAPLREALLTALAGVGDKDRAGVFRAALGDPAATVRLSAVKGLQRLGADDSVKTITPLMSDSDRGVRLAALSALGALGGFTQAQAILTRTDAAVESDAGVRQQAWTVVLDLSAKAEPDKLAALASQLSRRADGRDYLIRVLRIWIDKLPADQPDQWVPVRLRLVDALLATNRPSEAAVELAAVHGALAKANSPDAPGAWRKWIETLLEADDVACAAKMAETDDAAQFAAAVVAMRKRLDTLKEKKDWDTLGRLGEAGLTKLDARLDAAQKTAIAGLVREALVQQTRADRQRVSVLVPKLIGLDEPARQAAAKELAAMKARCLRPLLEDFKTLLAEDKLDAAGEKALLDTVQPIATQPISAQLKTYDMKAPLNERIKLVEACLAALAAPTSKPTTQP